MTKKGIKEIASIHHFLIYWKGLKLQKQSIFKILIFLFTLCGKQLWIQ